MRLTVQDASALLKVSEKSIYRWIKQGLLPVYKVNEQYRFNRAELLAWATSRRLNVSEQIFQEPATPLPGLTQALRDGGIIYRLGGRNRDEALRHLADEVRLPEQVDRDHLHELLRAREELGSTGQGRGLAIPQLIYPHTLDFSRPVITVAFLESPIEFDALDGRLVDRLVAVLSPTIRAYFHILTRLQFALHDEGVAAVLAQGGSREAIAGQFDRVEEALLASRSGA